MQAVEPPQPRAVGGIAFPRVASSGHRSTFIIPPVRELLDRYVYDGKGWADPFSGWSTLAEFRNDLRTHDDEGNKLPVESHMLAAEWAEKVCPDGLNGVLFDPPYSKRQISDLYSNLGKEAVTEDTNALFYTSVKNPLGRKVKPGGLAISFGYSSYGFGPNRGFEAIDGLLVNTGPLAYDIIVTVERKTGADSQEWVRPIEATTLEDW